MLKNKGPGYTARMKAKVSYPKLKKTGIEQKQEEAVSEPVSEEAISSPNIIRKETIILSKSQAPVENPTEDDKSSAGSVENENEEEPVKKFSSLSRKDTIVIQRHHDNLSLSCPDDRKSASPKDEVLAPVKSLPPRPGSGQAVTGSQSKSLSKPDSSNQNHVNVKPNTHAFRNPKFPSASNSKISPSNPVQKQRAALPRRDIPAKSCNSSVPSKEDVIYLVETEAIFEDKEHRKAILDLVTNYARNVHKEQILGILNHEIFDDVSHLEEAVAILSDFVAAKLNNNC